jgi:hypothetical protein
VWAELPLLHSDTTTTQNVREHAKSACVNGGVRASHLRSTARPLTFSYVGAAPPHPPPTRAARVLASLLCLAPRAAAGGLLRQWQVVTRLGGAAL